MILQHISLSWFPTSLHLKPCTCSAQWLQKASAPWTFLLALLFRALALLPSVIPPENLGSHKEFSVEPGSVCASQSVCRCQSSQLWSRILYSVLHSLVSSKKGKKKSPNNSISPHSSGCWNPSTHQMTPQPLHWIWFSAAMPHSIHLLFSTVRQYNQLCLHFLHFIPLSAPL